MNQDMKIDGNRVRALRERKSWSQEHLARASGVSERTIQRVEADGIGSAETRLALAAACAADVTRRLPLWGWLGWAMGVACSIALVAYGYLHGAFPLNQVAASILPWLALLGVGTGVMATRTVWRQWRS